MTLVGYQGVKGAFSHMTAVNMLGENNTFLGVRSFRELFELLEHGKVGCAVIPIENSVIGSIYENYDFLNQYSTQIIGETYTKITHCLLTVPADGIANEEYLKKIKKVFSHPKALEQCSQFFLQHPWIEPIVHADTAEAASDVAAWGKIENGAIASAYAGKMYGLNRLLEGIEDDPQNYTRFVIVTKKSEENFQSNKCSLLLSLKHVPGSLYLALKHFADKGINLTKIESRPVRGTPFTYVFYVDFEFSVMKRNEVDQVLNSLQKEVNNMRVLGFYKGGSLWIP